MSFLSRVGSGIKGAVRSVGGAAGAVARPVTQVTRYTGRQLDITSSRSVAGRGLGAVSRIPGASSALTVVTGGAAALNSRIRASAAREFATGAAVGGAVAAAGLASRSSPTDRAGATDRGSVADFSQLDAAQNGGGVAGPDFASFAQLDQVGSDRAAGQLAPFGGGGGGGGGGGDVASFAQLDQLPGGAASPAAGAKFSAASIASSPLALVVAALAIVTVVWLVAKPKR